ncbi:MAG TPA: hypothetical protein VFQ61_24150 [Polyangiaceae bacterium]|nr:hypothetical protein [Polyangiaceae bacterium]
MIGLNSWNVCAFTLVATVACLATPKQDPEAVGGTCSNCKGGSGGALGGRAHGGTSNGGATTEGGASSGGTLVEGGADASEAGAGGEGATGGITGSGGAAAGSGGDSGRAGGATDFVGGNGGEAGSTVVEPPYDCPKDAPLVGWAAVPGLEFTHALTGGGEGTTVTATTAEELMDYAGSVEPHVILVSGTITVPALDVKSNKTIRGADGSAKLVGGIRVIGTSIAAADMVSNVIIQNLSIDASGSNTSELMDEDDAITVAYAHHVWIDHVDTLDAGGDSIDITNGSDYVTVSWTRFRFANAARRTGVRVGNSDANSAEDAGRLKVTLHHNWFSDRVDQRMPRVRFGDVHVFNNYYSAVANKHCVTAGYESRLLVENNYFDGAVLPHVFFSFVDNTSIFQEPTAEMVVNDNTYVGDSDLPEGKQSGQGLSFVPPYSEILDPADEKLKEDVRHCAGPRPLEPQTPAPEDP